MARSVAKALSDGAALLIDATVGHGVSATHRPRSGGASSPCSIVIDDSLEPLLRGGQLIVEENQFSGSVHADEVAPIERGDYFTLINGSVYKVHSEPTLQDSVYSFLLRKESG